MPDRNIRVHSFFSPSLMSVMPSVLGVVCLEEEFAYSFRWTGGMEYGEDTISHVPSFVVSSPSERQRLQEDLLHAPLEKSLSRRLLLGSGWNGATSLGSSLFGCIALASFNAFCNPGKLPLSLDGSSLSGS